MMKEPLVSIIVPVYNVEKYLRVCLDSIIKQTYQNIEVVLVDDGSTDASAKICDEYAKNDERVRVFHEKNKGVAKARTFGIKGSKGTYIAFVDSDDMVNPDYIKELVSYASGYNAEIVSCGFRKFKDRIKLKKSESGIQPIIFDSKNALESLLYQKELDSSLWNKIIKRELFKGVEFSDLSLFEDLDIMYRLFLKAKKIIYIDNNLYYYRVRNESLMNKKFSDKNLVVIDVVKRMKKCVTEKYPDLEKACDSRMLSMYFYIYRNIEKINPLYESCIKNIKLLRDKVQKDSKISNRTRIGIMLSWINLRLIKLQNVLRAG